MPRPKIAKRTAKNLRLTSRKLRNRKLRKKKLRMLMPKNRTAQTRAETKAEAEAKAAETAEEAVKNLQLTSRKLKAQKYLKQR